MSEGLQHLRVLEVGGGVPAAVATKLLADLGAEVLKIEPPDGVDSRRRAPYDERQGVQHRSLYWAADIALMPSLWEGMPNAVLEAQACGLPAIVSHAANRDEIVEHSVTGLEVPTAHRPALAAAIGRLGNAPEDALERMGRAARQRMEQRFSPARVRGELLATYQRLLAASPAARARLHATGAALGPTADR